MHAWGDPTGCHGWLGCRVRAHGLPHGVQDSPRKHWALVSGALVAGLSSHPPVARGVLSLGSPGQIAGRGPLVSQEQGQKLGFWEITALSSSCLPSRCPGALLDPNSNCLIEYMSGAVSQSMLLCRCQS